MRTGRPRTGHRGMRQDLYLAVPQVKELRALSKKTGLTLSDLVRRAIDEYLKAQKERG